MYTEPVVITTLMGDRKVFRIAVSPAAKSVIATWANRADMTEIGVASRIYEWFARQPDVLQRAILGMFGERTPDVVKMALEQMEQSKAPDGPDVGKALAPLRAEVQKSKRRGKPAAG